MDINYKLIGRRISDIRKDLCITQEEMAEICDVSSGYISLVETGKKKASLKTLAAISDALSVSMDELVFGMSNEMKKQSDEWRSVIEDCSICELEILTETADAIKRSLRRHIENR